MMICTKNQNTSKRQPILNMRQYNEEMCAPPTRLAIKCNDNVMWKRRDVQVHIKYYEDGKICSINERHTFHC